ncbi:MAG: hypothetical protein KC503_27800 [Myxococcales bacterium]|nr:hypothetical protein [Myxococcales bacterium]
MRSAAITFTITFTCVLLLFGCGDSGSTTPADKGVDSTDGKVGIDGTADQSNPGACPTTKASSGDTCTVKENDQCSWPHTPCSSAYSINWICTCKNGMFDCRSDCLDCCRPGDMFVPDTADAGADGPWLDALPTQ